MKSQEIRQKFFEFFQSKNHKIVASAPIVVKNDPTLMFTNAGMNQFKDYFLGNKTAENKRIANTQKCLRVSGKHNDLEEVGHDTYHHTMFEMLGNWSFGDYFKKEAIEWAWELLHDVYGIDENRLYATYFGGDESENLDPDKESYEFWKKILPENRILAGSKKDNFWEMGETGPCGPCSEIHIDLRNDEQRLEIPGEKLVNTGNPEVIEIWNLVFIQFNRQSDKTLIQLPEKHVDTGMGFERLCMVLQGKKSNYDTDIFQSVIREITEITGLRYGMGGLSDVAMRVVADHLRAVAFAIADGQLPSNNKAGYVIRRILRRAIRYGFSYLNQKESFIYKLLPTLSDVLGNQFPELKTQQEFISKVIREEEENFLRTLDTGIKMLNQATSNVISSGKKQLDGKTAFILYDTYGFPVDLTQLILKEKNLDVDLEEFQQELDKQKQRSKQAGIIERDDWQMVSKEDSETVFVGYDELECDVKINRYRKIKVKNEEIFQLVFDKTPFYAESGGQVGDKGQIVDDHEVIEIIDTQKENDLIVHLAKKLPERLQSVFRAKVNESVRRATMKNHSATHLLHQALRKVLGPHVEQKGSYVDHERTRFDFSHFTKVSQQEIFEIEQFVNERIMENLSLSEERQIDYKKAIERGAIALFGEKYGDKVRMIQFGQSVELCGGTHVKNTGEIGFFKVVSESAIAAGIRRVEAVTGLNALKYIQNQEIALKNAAEILHTPSEEIQFAIERLLDENKSLKKENEGLQQEKMNHLAESLMEKAEKINHIYLIIKQINIENTSLIKDLVFAINKKLKPSVVVIGSQTAGKANLWVMLSAELIEEKGLNAVELIKSISKEIQGGGGGQPFFASAGGKNPEGIQRAMHEARKHILEKIQQKS
ncbi:MAG TPA: alanine--tRNA ligase [Bacteroidia bacterium]|nr:alanine--tRNA ligase [Bacteroidia bacterium]